MDEQLRELILLWRDQGKLGRTLGAIQRQVNRAFGRGDLEVSRHPAVTDTARVVDQLIREHELGIRRP
jgi:hypothetical protein